MKRVFSVFLLLAFTFGFMPSAQAAIRISAQAAVLYSPLNNKVYYSKNENKLMKPASTTKIMTALLTLEYAEKHNKRVKFTQKMAAEGSSMYLKLGEVISLRDLAVGLMLCSSNDAANAAAISIAGSKRKFASLMNERAKKIGMKNTHFVTPSGLDNDNHYSTAYDLALLMAEAMKNKSFMKLSVKRSETVVFIKPKNKRVTYSNHNRLLSLYKHCVGGKTGYTMAAGRCLVSASEKDGLPLIAVTLNDKNDWNDHISLYDYGYQKYRFREFDDTNLYLEVDVVGGKNSKVMLTSDDNSGAVVKAEDLKRIKRKIYLDNFLYAPVKKGSVLGRIVYFLNGKILAVNRLTTCDNVD